MKLLVGCSSPPDVGAGGILTYTREIVECFLERGHDVFIAAPGPDDWGWIKNNGLKFFETDQYRDPKISVSELVDFINENKIDGVINNDNPYVQSALPAVKATSIVIGHLGECVIASLACFQKEWSDYVVTISNDMCATYVHDYKVPVMKCPVVLNGVKDNGCKDDLTNSSRRLKVVFAGGTNKRKGSDHILSSVKSYASRIDEVELNWFGFVSDAVRSELEEYEFVKLHGHVTRNQFMKVLEDSDVLLFPSKSEGCPMAMLEAMSYGVVPIASNGIGAMASLITTGSEGYICHLDSWSEQATSCLSYLNENRDVLGNMKYSVRDKFLKQFQRETVAEKLLELLSKPTVDRNNLPEKINVLRWHRPVPKGQKKATLLNRVRYKFGVLRSAGHLHIKQ